MEADMLSAAGFEPLVRGLADSERIRAPATPALVAYLRECEVVPDEVALCDADLWSHLEPCWIEVHGGTDANAC